MNLFPSHCYFLVLFVYAQESGGWGIPGVKAETKLLRKLCGVPKCDPQW